MDIQPVDTSHIYVEYTVLRVVVQYPDKIPVADMSADFNKPQFVLWVHPNNHPSLYKHTILVCCKEKYNLEELARWVSSYEK